MKAWIRVMASEMIRSGLTSLMEGQLGLEMGEVVPAFVELVVHCGRQVCKQIITIR